MRILDSLFSKLGYVRGSGSARTAPGKRSFYEGASTSRLFNDWTTTNYSADRELNQSLGALRARSRNAYANNDYAKRYISMVAKNIVGAGGVQLQSLVSNASGKPDQAARREIEAAWRRWVLKGQCDVTGLLTFRDICNMVCTSCARDGEVLIRLVPGFDNPFRYAVQLIESDHLDENYHETLANGNVVKMGIEYRPQWGQPVAYHLFQNHPGDTRFFTSNGDRVAVPAEQILHLFLPNRISQTRGLPWMHSALSRLQMVGKYEESELVAARVSASKMGFYEKSMDAPGASQYTGDDTQAGQPIMEVEPGTFEALPHGWTFKSFDPQHPSTAFAAFYNSVMLGIASGLDMSYSSLTGDLSKVNFSSIRAGIVEERDVWKGLQTWLIDHFCKPIFADWLPVAMLAGEINLPIGKVDKFRPHGWQARGFQWVDPQKEVNAQLTAIRGGLKSASEVVAEGGRDLLEVYEQIQADIDLAKQMQLIFPELNKGKENGPNAEDPNGSDDNAGSTESV